MIVIVTLSIKTYSTIISSRKACILKKQKNTKIWEGCLLWLKGDESNIISLHVFSFHKTAHQWRGEDMFKTSGGADK